MMMAYWKQLNEREQWSVIGGAILFIAYLFYLLIYAPLILSVTTATNQLQEKRETLVWMEQMQMQYANPNQSVKKIDPGALLTMISAQLQSPAFKPFPYDMKQTGTGNIQINFDLVPYSMISAWLKRLTDQYQVQIKSLRIEQSTTPGSVHFNLELISP